MDDFELRCVNTWNRREPTSHKFLSETVYGWLNDGAFNSNYVKEKKMEEEEETYN